MAKDWIIRLLEAAAITITIAAIAQELEKSPEERTWHGKLGFIPYDFRFPGLRRFRDSLWNPDDERVFTEPVFGPGWGINFFRLLEKCRIVRESYLTEDDFLMPTPTLRKVLEERTTVTEGV